MCWVCEVGVYSEIVLYIIMVVEVVVKNLVGIVLSGGFLSVYEEGLFDFDCGVFELGVLMFGICYGF